ncbi:unnamed protein product [Adineta ricciae]|uniref:Uncharacterized protein n=1 Tax=Adineta ricciae TaxID=249248 RepID=A0A815HQM8_ADIRI|nr:unnamed protein product [Adineta ricciae]CAF1357176.1 unnamed protein product [Adineta ricciae]
MMNSSSHISAHKNDIAYDSTGEILFIIAVLIWYSLGMVCMLGMQIKARDETVEDCARRRAKALLETLHDQTHTKQILEELVDKQKRDRLWDIYLGTSENNSEKVIQDDLLRIRNIEKQLAAINQNRIFANESLISSTIFSDIIVNENRVRVRRRSSLDQQIIERWKILVEQCRKHEQLPWSIQKLMIRRHFRRHYKTMLQQSDQINMSMDDEKHLTSDY